MQIEDLRAASNGLCPFGLRLRRNRTLSGKVHELKARETSQEPLALGQMLGKNPRAGFSYVLIISINICKRGGPIPFLDLGCGAATPAWSGPRWSILFAEGPIHFKVVRQE